MKSTNFEFLRPENELLANLGGLSALVTAAAIFGVLAALQYTIILWRENK